MALLVSTFLDWFTVEIPESIGIDFFVDGTGQTAWNTLDYLPVVLCVTVAAALIMVMVSLADRGRENRAAVSLGVALLGLVSTGLIIYRIIHPPDFGSFTGTFGKAIPGQLSVSYGIFIGLVAAVGVALGGYAALRAAASERG
jgi:hypothetical protein